MFEVIISAICTGQVYRKTFPSRERANRFIDRQLERWAVEKRSARNYRIEVQPRLEFAKPQAA
jgi:hypothetical protein